MEAIARHIFTCLVIVLFIGGLHAVDYRKLCNFAFFSVHLSRVLLRKQTLSPSVIFHIFVKFEKDECYLGFFKSCDPIYTSLNFFY